MNLKNIFSFILISFLMTTSLKSQVKVAHINTQQLISEMPEVIAKQKELAQLEKTYTTEIENTIKEFQTKAQSYAADAENQTEVTNCLLYTSPRPRDS